jgi:ribosome-binding ATPase
VEVKDPRLEVLKDMYKSNKIIPSTLEFVDIAGIVKGASKGEGFFLND